MLDVSASDLQSESASRLCLHIGLQGTAGGYGLGASGQQLGDAQSGGGGGGFGAHYATQLQAFLTPRTFICASSGLSHR